MKQQITIQQNYPINGKANWVDLITVTADVELGRGKNWFSANKINSAVEGWFKIPYIQGITPNHRIKFDGRIWTILYIIGQETRRYLEITVKGGGLDV